MRLILSRPHGTLHQYLELLSEHEDLLQLLAQQDVVRKKLLEALEVSEPPAAGILSHAIHSFIRQKTF